MTLLLIGLFGLVALIAVLCALEVAWHKSDHRALGAFLGDDGPSAGDVERALVADLLSGSISAAQYRDAAGTLAAGEPQPAALQRLVG